MYSLLAIYETLFIKCVKIIWASIFFRYTLKVHQRSKPTWSKSTRVKIQPIKINPSQNPPNQNPPESKSIRSKSTRVKIHPIKINPSQNQPESKFTLSKSTRVKINPNRNIHLDLFSSFWIKYHFNNSPHPKISFSNKLHL